jgi:hypothetical protein
LEKVKGGGEGRETKSNNITVMIIINSYIT